MAATDALLRQLSVNSSPYRDPLALVSWHQLAAPGPWLPDEALSLYGLPELDALPAATRHRLSRYEFLNVMCCGLWLEGLFVRRMARRLATALPRAQREYLLHELREESGHSLMFLRAIEAAGVDLPEGSWRAPRAADIAGRSAPAGGGLFWLAMLIGEDVPDRFNRYVRGLGDAANPAVRQISSLHAVDEARHIVLAKRMLEENLAGAGRLRRAALGAAARLLLRQMTRTFYFPPARFYELAGLGAGARWRAAALRNPARWRFVRSRAAPTVRALESLGLTAGF
jgi:hypothetical protein